MADVAERSGQIAPELPTKNLPGVEYRDLPEPASLRRYMGASVILAATAMGSGELIIWPFITTQVGIGLLWFMAIGFTAQYFLNMEIERYTLATGETAVTGFTRFWKPWGIIFILGAILPNAWAGGCNNLVQSNYVRDKQMGMGAHIPRIVSPITGEEEAEPSLGYMFETNEENMRRWRGWWKVANQEHFITFLLLGLLSLIALSVLVYATVGVQDLGRDLDFVRAEGDTLKETIAPWFGTFFYIAGFAVLFSTNIGIIDYVSRLTADSLKVTFLRESTFWSESKIYITVAWLLIVAGSIIMLTVSSQPLVLLIISSAGGGVLMFFYSGMLILLNRRALPDPIKLKSWRLWAMWFSFLFFGSLSGYLLYSFLAG